MRYCGLLGLGLAAVLLAGAGVRAADVPTVAGQQAAAAAKLPEALSILPSGAFSVDSLLCQIVHLSQSKQQVEQVVGVRSARMQSGDMQSELTGRMVLPSGAFDLQQTIKSAGENAFRYDATLHNEQGIDTFFLGLQIRLPAEQYAGQNLVVDGAAVVLPEKQAGASGLLHRPFVSQVMVATPGGVLTIDGPAEVLVQDDRQYSSNTFTVRFYFAPGKGVIKDSKLKLRFAYQAN